MQGFKLEAQKWLLCLCCLAIYSVSVIGTCGEMNESVGSASVSFGVLPPLPPRFHYPGATGRWSISGHFLTQLSEHEEKKKPICYIQLDISDTVI